MAEDFGTTRVERESKRNLSFVPGTVQSLFILLKNNTRNLCSPSLPSIPKTIEMRPALTLLTFLPYLGMTFANTCRAAGTSAAATASGDASSTKIWFNLLDPWNTAAGGGATTVQAASVSSGGIDASATDSSAAHATSAAVSVSAGDHSSASSSVTPGTSLVQSAAYPEGSQMGTDLVLSNPSDDCKCGYSISSLNGEYFPFRFAYTFSALSDGDAKDGLAAAGWVVNDGKYVGGAANGNRCWGNLKNVHIDSGDLVLTVPKNQRANPHMECAEIAFNETNLFEGVFQTEALLSGVDGTCQAFVSFSHQSYTFWFFLWIRMAHGTVF